MSSNGDSKHTNGSTLLTPAPNGIRRPSGGGTSHINGLSQHPRSPSPSPSADTVQWSSAVGHATTGGKSGRVIEKLQADNDKLRRELREAQMKAEDLQQEKQSFQPQMEALRTEAENLSHANSVNQSLLARRDRQIKELRQELDVEKSSRKALASSMQEMQGERDDAVLEKDRTTQSCLERTKHAEIQTDTLQTSHRQLQAMYQAKTSNIAKEIQLLQREKKEDQAKLAKLEVVHDQLRQEVERSQKLQSEMVTKWEQLQRASDQRVREVVEEGKSENEKVRNLSVEMDEVVNKMRWVMGLKQNTQLGGT